MVSISRALILFLTVVVSTADAGSMDSVRCEALFTNSIAVRAKSMGTHVIDLEYRILKHLIKESGVFRTLADQVSPYQQWNIVSQLVPTFERKVGNVDEVTATQVAKAFSISRRQAVSVIEILQDLKQLTRLDFLRVPSLGGTVTQANERLRNFEYNWGERSIFTRVIRTKHNKRRLDVETNFRDATNARLKELEPIRSATNEDVERLFTEWINLTTVDESRTHSQRHQVENASLALEKTAGLVSAMNRIEVANGQSYLTASRVLAKSADHTAWTKEVLDQLARKQAQLALMKERLDSLEHDLATEPGDARAAVDAEDARMQLAMRLQWMPLIDYWRQTMTLKQAVFVLQAQALESGLAVSYLNVALKRN